MYSAFLDLTKKRLAAAKKHAELSQVLINTFHEKSAEIENKGSELIAALAAAAPDRLEWRLIEHCSVVTRIYAIYEQFSQEMIKAHLSLLQLRFKYAELSEAIRSTHRRGMAFILDKKDGPRYGHLNLDDLIRQYNNALSGAAYNLEPSAFLVQEQNLRLSELSKLFSGCGVQGIDAWIEQHQAVVEFFSAGSRLGSTAEHEMRELIKYRNDAAHGVIEFDELPGVDYLYEFCDFIEAVCDAIAEKVLSEGVDKLIDAKHASACGKITNVLKDGTIIIGKLIGDFEVGNEIVLRGANYCKSVVINSLQVNDINHDKIALAGDVEVGMKISSPVRKNATVYRFVDT